MERLGGRASSAALGRHCQARLAHRVKEEFLAGALLNQMLLGWTKNFHDASKLFLLILAGENGYTSEELSEDAADTPHVNWQTVSHSQDNLWGSVETRLNIGINLFVLKAARAEIDDL